MDYFKRAISKDWRGCWCTQCRPGGEDKRLARRSARRLIKQQDAMEASYDDS